MVCVFVCVLIMTLPYICISNIICISLDVALCLRAVIRTLLAAAVPYH